MAVKRSAGVLALAAVAGIAVLGGIGWVMSKALGSGSKTTEPAASGSSTVAAVGTAVIEGTGAAADTIGGYWDAGKAKAQGYYNEYFGGE